ncbi:MAG: oligosaccharide flippase family protein [Candidatus Nealsonbacteria bacterium]
MYKFLRKTQKYTGTDNVYLARGGFWLTLGQVMSMAASFLLAIVFANLLDPVIYGNYKYVLSLIGLLGVFSFPGIRSAINQAVARGLEGSFYTGFRAQCKLSVLGSLVAIAAAVYYLIRGNEILPIPLLLTAVFFPLMEASQIYISFLAGRKLFDMQTKYGIINQIFIVIVTVSTLLLTKNLFWLLTVYLVSRTVLNYAFYLITKIRFMPNQKEDSQTINFGIHLSLMAFIGQIAAYLDKVLVFTSIGAGSLAIYSFATLAPEQIQNIIGNVSALALPKLAPRSREEIKATIMKKVWKLFLLTIAVTILYIVLAPLLFKIFFPQYLGSVLYSQVYMLSILTVPISLLGTAFQAKMMKKELYWLKSKSFIRVGLFVIFIPLYGVWGALAAIIGSEIYGASLILFLFRKF